MTARMDVLDLAGPDDVAGIAASIAAAGAANIRRALVLMKIEGTALPGDVARELARRALEDVFAATGLAGRAVAIFATGCEGVATPIASLLLDIAEDIPASPAKPARLAFGIATSAKVPPALIGQPEMIDLAAETLRDAMDDAGLHQDQIRLVLMKLPILPARVAGATPAQTSMPRGRALAALGIAVGLGEVVRAAIAPEAIGRDTALRTHRGMTFAGPELSCIEVAALGLRPGAGGDLLIGTTDMADIIDAQALRALLDPIGRPDLLLIKAGVAADGLVRGGRTLVHGSFVPPEWHMRAAMSGVVGAVLGGTRFFASADPVHAAPPGGGFAAAIYRAPAGPG